MEIKKLEILNAEFTQRWESFVQNHPKGNFFQAPAAYEFFSNVEGYTPIMVYVEEEKNIKGILSAVVLKESGIKGYYSRRCIVWGGPLYENADIAERLIKKLDNEISSKTIYTEFRNLFDLTEINKIFISIGYNFTDWINYHIQVKSFEMFLMDIKPEKRRQYKKAINNGVSAVTIKSKDDLDALYEIFKQVYLDKIKKPLPSFEFFYTFLMKNIGYCIGIKDNSGKIIGGAICPVFGEIMYDWYRCGLDKEYKSFYPSLVAVIESIKLVSNLNYKVYDFMGAGKPEEDYGVREFKSKFGGTEVRFGRYIKINKPYLYWLGKTGLKLLGKF